MLEELAPRTRPDVVVVALYAGNDFSDNWGALRAAGGEKAVLPDATRKTYRGYGEQDVFYEAPGTYHFANTCNQWTSDTLSAAGIKTGWWTPLAGGVMKWVPEYAGD